MQLCSESDCGRKSAAIGLCSKHYQRHRANSLKDTPVPTGTKACTACDEQKPFTEFLRGNGPQGFRRECRTCRAAYCRDYRKDPSRPPAWRQKARKKFGLSDADLDRMTAEQNGRCSICRSKPEEKDSRRRFLCVDHDHATGRVRGLLCSPCNTAIGQMRDSPALLKMAAAYLLKRRD